MNLRAVDALFERMCQLRANVTPYDAAYIALAEQLDCAFITCDTKLVIASGPRCVIEPIA
jgi:predicted nucleic acid-binding protein